MDKLKYRTINNKKIIFFLLVLGLIGLITGSFFTTILSSSDQGLVKEYIQNFMTNIASKELNYFSSLNNSLLGGLGYMLVIWLLGISVIGIPIVLFMYFSKFFILGFSISSFILTYKFKGMLLAFFYIFPEHIISLILYLLITLYSVKMSFNLIYSVFKKKEINLKIFISKYLIVLLVAIIGISICSLYETFIVPFILNKLSFLIK